MTEMAGSLLKYTYICLFALRLRYSLQKDAFSRPVSIHQSQKFFQKNYFIPAREILLPVLKSPSLQFSLFSAAVLAGSGSSN